MSPDPEFRDLVGDDLTPEEEARLQRVHELLIGAGPPPELPRRLAEPPRPEGRLVTLARNRVRTGLVLAAAIVLAAFAVGYLFGARSEESGLTAGFTPAQTVVLGKSGGKLAVVRIGERDGNGNRPMLVTVEGLDRQTGGDYYTLFMTRNGKPTVVCGTFNVDDKGSTTVRLNVAYDLERFDGLMLTEWRRATREDVPLLRARL
jgi:hypothetical protein